MVSIKNSNMKYSGQWRLSGLLIMLITGVLLATPAFAQTDAEHINALELKLERSLKMLDDLSNKIEKLEADKKEASGGVSDADSRLMTVEQQVSQMVTGMASRSSSGHEGDGAPLHGFADVGFALNNNGNPATNPKGFNVGSFVLFLTPQFGDNVKSLVELAFGVHSTGSTEAHLERVQVGYTFSDTATVWAGRFHTPYGYWNTGFHHGAQIQTSIMRPRFLDFEDHESLGGVLPAHMVGLWATGKVKAGNGRLTYDAFVGNGPKIEVVDPGLVTQAPGMLNPNMGGDDNHSAMVGMNVGYEFSGSVEGLRVAGHWLEGNVDDNAVNPAGRNNRTGVSMTGGSAVYLANDMEVLSEYYHFNNKDKSGTTGTHKSWAGYLQVGKNFTNFTPFVRLEKSVLSQQDSYFSMQMNGQSYTRQALGLKYDVNPKASLKFELLHSDFDADVGRTANNYGSLLAQYAIRF